MYTHRNCNFVGSFRINYRNHQSKCVQSKRCEVQGTAAVPPADPFLPVVLRQLRVSASALRLTNVALPMPKHRKATNYTHAHMIVCMHAWMDDVYE